MAFELGPLRERNSAEHVNDVLGLNLPAVVAMQNVSGEINVLALAGRAIKLDQGHLDFRMSGDDGFLIWPRPVIRNNEVVHHACACIHQG